MGRKSRVKTAHDVRASTPGTAGAAKNWPILILSLLGLALTAYLSWAASSGSGLQGCGIDSGCDTVLSSRWATLLGVPTSTWGLLAYATLAATAFMRRTDRQWLVTWVVSFFGVVYSVYLTTVSITLLGATCPYCLTSLTIMTALFVVATSQRPAGQPAFAWGRLLARAVPAAAVVIALLHLNYVGVIGQPPAVEDPTLRALAVHLGQRGVKMYGASWCPHCIEQKEIFGASAKRLPYVECSSGGPGTAQTSACQAAAITQYPTWIIDGQRYKEILTPTRLAELTGFQPPAARP